MRARKWVLYLFAVLLVSLLLFVQGWRFFKANERIKTYILTEIRPVLGEKCNISQVRLGFGNIRFVGVDIPLPDQQFSVHIKDIRIGLNIFSLLIRGFNPQAVSQDILLINPRLNIKVAAADSTNKSSDLMNYPANISEIKNSYKKQLKQIEFLKRLSIKKGEIYYQGYDSLQVLLANSIEGGFFVDPSDSIEIRLTGKLFTSKHQNLSLNGKVWGKTGTISYIKAELEDYNLQDRLPDFLFSALDFKSGQLNGDILLFRKPAPNSGFDIRGGFVITQGNVVADDGRLVIGDINIRSRFERWNMLIDYAQQKVNGNNVKLSGRIKNILNPHFYLQVNAENFQLGDISGLPIFKIQNKISGKANVVADIEGPLTDVVIKSTITTGSLLVDELKIEKIVVHNTWSKAHLLFNQCRFSALGNHFVVNARVDSLKEKKLLSGTVTMQGDMGDIFEKLTANYTHTCSSRLEATLGGSTNKPLIAGNCGLVLINRDNDTTAVAANFQVDGATAQITGKTAADTSAFRVRIEKKSVTQLNAIIKNVQDYVFRLWKFPGSDYLVKNLAIAVNLNGTLRDFIVDWDVNKIEGGYFKSALADLSARVIRSREKITADGTLVMFSGSPDEYSGKFVFKKEKDQYKLDEFSLGSDLNAKISAITDSTGQKILDGFIKTNNLNIPATLGIADSLLAGKLDMDLAVKGTLLAPEVTGEINVNKLLYKQVGPYDAHASINLHKKGIELHRFSIGTREATLLYAQGHFLRNDSLDILIKGAGFDLNKLWQVTNPDDAPFSGQTLIDLEISGTRHNPAIKGLIAIKDGLIYGVPFNEVEIHLAENPHNYPGVFIEKFRLTRQNQFELTANGFYPYNPRDSLSIDLRGQGNFLQILTDKISFFAKTASSGSLAARVTGSPMNPVLLSANLALENGLMHCGSVIPPITNISGQIEFIPENQFISIKTLDGLMGGKKFHIFNTLASPALSVRPLRNIILGDTGLNLGVIIPETPDNGIPLNIKGLMENDVFGTLDVHGRDGDMNFYFAAVEDRLTLRGAIDLYDCEIMYPFYEGAGTPSETIEYFLKNLEWDILVTPKNDVRFVRTFPAAIDNVYVNLHLNDETSRLDFTGQIEDESFRIIGEVRSAKGFIEYLDMNFRVERAGAEFDRSSLIPVVYGQARTTVTDTTGFSSQIMLTLQTYDVTMDKKPVDDNVRQEQSRGRWDQIRFKLSSDNPNVGSTEAQILSSLGYSNATLQKNPAIDVIGYGTENILFRPLFRPVERKLEETFGLDYIRFSSRFTKNFIDFNLNNNMGVNSRLALLKSTRLVVGKYLADQLFFQYTGQVETGIYYRYKDKNLGLHHQLGLEYHINPRLLLELEYDYDSMIWNKSDRDDKRVVLRHWFPF
ncbi:MAG TPA: translocation/assembly module TamB domain-containing protein [bacterium]|nr:translocation/assembly module TamB domain-containing protein [bacterium]HPN42275.1 translocation/assembly module TamB domain-containing protein [bacterium]